MTDEEMRALLVPHLRPRTRLEATDKPIVTRLVELAPATEDPVEPALIAALVDPEGIAVYADWLEQHGLAERAHWMRIYPDGDLLAATRFGGTPAAPRDDVWPVCACGELLRFVAQISGGDVDAAWFRLLAFYYCWHCHEGWLVRAYPETPPGELVRRAAPDGMAAPEQFVRAIREPSLPHYLTFASQLRAAEIPLLERTATALCGLPLDAARNTGNAVGGYPDQFHEPPRCVACKESMELLLQLEGDLVLWVYSCARHRDLFALRT